MTKKLSQRKQSRVVTEAISAAHQRLAHLTPEQRLLACQEYLQRERDLAIAPSLVQVIRKYGVIDALRGYTDEDIKELIDAQRLADREIASPGDFVSAKVFSAAQANANGKSETYDRELIRQTAKRLGYFELKKGSHKRRPLRLKILEKLQLRQENPSTSDDSWNRQLARILDQP